MPSAGFRKVSGSMSGATFISISSLKVARLLTR
jgi:hypothetical protein